mgnify:CR=1 FL=1
MSACGIRAVSWAVLRQGAHYVQIGSQPKSVGVAGGVAGCSSSGVCAQKRDARAIECPRGFMGCIDLLKTAGDGIGVCAVEDCDKGDSSSSEGIAARRFWTHTDPEQITQGDGKGKSPTGRTAKGQIAALAGGASIQATQTAAAGEHASAIRFLQRRHRQRSGVSRNGGNWQGPGVDRHKYNSGSRTHAVRPLPMTSMGQMATADSTVLEAARCDPSSSCLWRRWK